MIKRFLKYGFQRLGYNIQKVGTSHYSPEFSLEHAFQRCITRGLAVNTVIDIGASDGRWSEICMNYLPKAKYLLIEAQDGHRQKLEQFKSKYSNSDYVLAAAGRKEGMIYFDNTDLFGGLASETPFEKNYTEVPVITIDEEVERRNLKGPFLIKLDTHGFEIPIIEGGLNTVKSGELIVIETYNYKLTNDSLKFFQMCMYMEKLGFSPIEMIDFGLRKLDHSLWQMDTFFIPSDRKEFSCNSYE